MSLARRRFTSRNVPRFSPSGDDQIGTVSGRGGVIATQLLLDWFDLVAIRLENIMTRSGAVIMTHESGEPEGWLQLNGQLVSANTYGRLAEIYGSTDGLVQLPDMTNFIPMGAGSLVANNETAGAAEITLLLSQLPKHAPPVIDGGHFHGAEDRGHDHDKQDDSHFHSAEEDPSNQHTHPVNIPSHGHATTQNNHSHSGGLGFTAGNELAAGTDYQRPIDASTGSAEADITIVDTLETQVTSLEPTAPLRIEISEEETQGTNMPGRADIRIHKAQSNISIGEVGNDAPINILNPVRGFNFLVKT